MGFKDAVIAILSLADLNTLRKKQGKAAAKGSGSLNNTYMV
ncbi:hypothetical protein [Aneurinibacillus migulanus]|nr:hypothetical protein [Aneurinibacillus migulanus]